MIKKIKTKKPRVVVAMSGGVDSSVAAALLKKQGYDVVGVFMQFWYPEGESYGENRCCSLESFNEAREVARILDIPIHKLNFGRQFKDAIVDEFLAEYSEGKTPNPCVSCNKFIKFDLLLKQALKVFDADYLATGHYVKLVKKGKTWHLFKAKDQQKDQTYFLYNLDQDKLKHLLFPLANFNKTKVRALAKKLNLAVHAKADSQEICFVGASHYDFLKKYLHLKPGTITDEDGLILGEHQGLALYTYGQRSGLLLSGGPWYVCQKDYGANRLVVTKDQAKSAIFAKGLHAHKISWLGKEPKMPFKCQAVIRYHGQPAACVVDKDGDTLKVVFTKEQRAMAPGQSVAFYKGKELLGGGVII